MTKVSILILAAGTSSRMNTPKQLLPIGTKTLLGSSIEQAIKSEASCVFCVLGASYERIKREIEVYNIEIIHNTKYLSGISSSIVCGIKHILSKSNNPILIMLADQPKIDSEYINKLIAVFLENPEFIVASKYSDTFGVPAIFPSYTFGQLLELKGDRGAKALLNADKTTVIALENPNISDIDTPKDYQDFLNSIN